MVAEQGTVTAAKRGDLVVIHVRSTSWSARYERTEQDDYTVGIVTSVTRDGQVRRYRPAGDLQTTDYLGRPYRGQDMPRTGYQGRWIMPAAHIDVTGAVVTAACHVWQGHETTQAYGSLCEVQDALRPHLRRRDGWETLRNAAVTWETERRTADEAYRQAGQEANRAHAQAGYGTRAGNEARHAADRAAMDAHSAAIRDANARYRGVYATVTEPANAAA